MLVLTIVINTRFHIMGMSQFKCKAALWKQSGLSNMVLKADLSMPTNTKKVSFH